MKGGEKMDTEFMVINLDSRLKKIEDIVEELQERTNKLEQERARKMMNDLGFIVRNLNSLDSHTGNIRDKIIEDLLADIECWVDELKKSEEKK